MFFHSEYRCNSFIVDQNVSLENKKSSLRSHNVNVSVWRKQTAQTGLVAMLLMGLGTESP